MGEHNDILDMALHLNQLNVSAIEYFNKHDVNNLTEVVKQFYVLKREIKNIIVGLPLVAITNKLSKLILDKINNDEPFEIDIMVAVINNQEIHEYIDNQSDIELLGDYEYYKLEDELLNSWFDSRNFVSSLYYTGSLILGVVVPDHVKIIVDEIRKCMAFKQCNAACSLCRTLLESCLRDSRLNNKIIANNNKHNSNYKLHKLVNIVKDDIVKKEITDLYEELCAVSHGFNTIEYKDAIIKYKETIRIVSRLYELSSLL